MQSHFNNLSRAGIVLRQRLVKQIESASLAGILINPDRPIIHIDSGQQLLSCVSQSDSPVQYYSVSTSSKGLGQRNGSYQTPAGIHRIAEKIGDAEPVGRVFKSRQPTDEICLAEDYDDQGDVISTRILWLEGLQPGVNRGGNVDTFERYIYIHGTADEAHIGQPASIGCIRMKNLDVLSLYDRVQEGDLVVID